MKRRGGACPPADRHEPDRMIAAAAAARCDILVSDDKGLLEYSKRVGVRAMDWNKFITRIVFRNH
jgi:predicted nucleic acid-binding protein